MLILDNVKIRNLKFLHNMSSLERLDLMNCNIKKVSRIKKCSNLKLLTFNQENMNNVKGMDELKGLETLTISEYNNIE